MWKTKGHREFDFNKDPAKSRDLSFERLWHRKTLDTEIEVVKPTHTPILLKNVPAQFCTNDSTSNLKLLNTRKWNSKSMDQNFPRIRFVVNQTTDLFNWAFLLGSKNKLHEYETWSKTNKVNNTKVVTQLSDLNWNLQEHSAFNLSISCAEYPIFLTKLNYWEPGDDHIGNRRTENAWDSSTNVDESVDPNVVKEIIIDGGITVDYAGITSEGCLSLTSNGLITPNYGISCSVIQDVVCEHQSCYTHQGDECIFPFPYKGTLYHNCTSVDVYIPWCATGACSITSSISDEF